MERKIINPHANITTEFEKTSGGYSIVIVQDSDMIAITNKADALKLADKLRELATRWTDDPMPTDRKAHDGYNWVADRGCD